MPTSSITCCQRGVALLTVLLVVFLASIAAVSLASVQQLAIRRTTLLLHQQQARLYTLGVEQWAGAILKRDRQKSNTDHLGEDWATLPPALPVEGGKLSGRIEDLQGRFNINNLLNQATPPPTGGGDPEEEQAEDENLEDDQTGDGDPVGQPMDPNQQREAFVRLLESLELNPGIAQAIIDWIDPDQEPLFPDGAEDSEYVGRTPPYLAANRPLLSISELRLIKGIDQEAYARLAPYVCALPQGTKLNINTAPAPVLAAIGNLDLRIAEILIEGRGPKGYDTLEPVLAMASPEERTRLPDRLAVTSTYFLVRVEANVGDGRAILNSVLQRTDSGGTRILRRSFGNDD